jgi:hypothetical protein
VAGFCARYTEGVSCPIRALTVQLAEQARNRDHDSSDPCGQAKKQQKVTQEHRHKALPNFPSAGHVDIQRYCPWFDIRLRNITNYFAHGDPIQRCASQQNCPADDAVWVIHVIPAIPACSVRPKSEHSANAAFMSTRPRRAKAGLKTSGPHRSTICVVGRLTTGKKLRKQKWYGQDRLIKSRGAVTIGRRS